MDDLFKRITIADMNGDLARNIVSIRESQDLYDDLSDNHDDWQLAQKVEDDVKPPPFQSRTPIIDRPFENAEWFNAIEYPFRNWKASRFSDGTFGVWYGSANVETTVYETVHHWYHGLLKDAGFIKDGVCIERKVYWVHCKAALLDFRPLIQDYPDLVNSHDYGFTQAVGARLHHEGHPGLATMSARYAGENFAVLNQAVLSNPKAACYLSYRLMGSRVEVERQQGEPWFQIEI